MPNQFDRRQLLAMIAAPAIAGVAAVTLLPATAMAEPVMGDVVLGDEAAPVAVIEYASFTCPHGAAFDVGTLPAVKGEECRTGQGRVHLGERHCARGGAGGRSWGGGSPSPWRPERSTAKPGG